MKNKIKVLRAERDWTQEDLSVKTGISRQTINAIEKGKVIPSVISMQKIAKTFEVPITEIFLDLM